MSMVHVAQMKLSGPLAGELQLLRPEYARGVHRWRVTMHLVSPVGAIDDERQAHDQVIAKFHQPRAYREVIPALQSEIDQLIEHDQPFDDVRIDVFALRHAHGGRK